MSEIDIIIPWVDGADPEWVKEKEKYEVLYKGDKGENRFRSWDNLEYLFRGIEKFLPWIGKIHFVTWGHVPDWIDTNNPKLHIVRHSDYIPQEYLPTFSSHPIEMNFHRIEGLSEQFIYANDDMFFIRPMSKSDFFVDGKPCDCSAESVHQFKKGGIDHIVGNNLEILNGNFSKRKTIKNFWKKWYSIKYKKMLLKNLYLMPFGNFVGFENPHMPIAYLKSTFEEIWEKEFEALDRTSRDKFRSNDDVNQWLARYWQFASGNFNPGNPKLGKFFSIGRDDELICKTIRNQDYAMICLSDDDVGMDFEKEKKFIKECFEMILPEKSSFEK